MFDGRRLAMPFAMFLVTVPRAVVDFVVVDAMGGSVRAPS